MTRNLASPPADLAGSHRLRRILVAALVTAGAMACADPAAHEADPPEDGSPPRIEPAPAKPEVLDSAAQGPPRFLELRSEAGRGRWHQARGAATLTEEQRREIAELRALGYLSGSRPAGELAGVTRHDRERAFDGYNLYSSGHAPEALLIDMKGALVHRWRADFWKIWPDYPVDRELLQTQFLRRLHLYPNGDLLVIFEGLGLVKLDRDSRVVWARPIAAHHDLEVLVDGTIYVLTRQAHMVPRVNARRPILEDFVSILDSLGRELERFSILEALERSEYHRFLDDSDRKHGDLLHTNTLEVLDGRLADRLPAFAGGNVLVSIRALDLLAVLDLEEERVVWGHRGGFRAQHDPEVLPNGNLLLFDNKGRGEASSIQQIDPTTGTVAWRYVGTPEAPFYSATLGTVEHLPNGNVLVTESDAGRAFELTPEHEIVWEYYNPHRAGAGDQLIATLFEVVRWPPDFPLGWAGRRPAG